MYNNISHHQKKVLIVAAHPDDEVLGCGGAIAKHSDQGDIVNILIVAEGLTSRSPSRNRLNVSYELTHLEEAAQKSSLILGAQAVQLLDLPDNRLDSLDRLDLVKIIEDHIFSFQPQIVYVHHCGDVNIDHRLLHEAVVTACRPTPDNKVLRLLSYEVPSSTEWQTPGSAPLFQPNYFINIEDQFTRKLQALECYSSEMRNWPHPRSIRAVKHLSSWRGSQVGFDVAEAFCLLRALK